MGLTYVFPLGVTNHSLIPRHVNRTIAKLKNQGLAVSADEKGTLVFQKKWTTAQIDQWLRELLLKPFEYLDTKWGIPDGEFHWVLVKIYRKRLLEKQGENPNGYDLLEAIGNTRTAWNSQKVVVVLRYHIPRKITSSFEGKEIAQDKVSESKNEHDRDGMDEVVQCTVSASQLRQRANMPLAASGSLFGTEEMDSNAVAGPSTISTRATTAATQAIHEEENWMAWARNCGLKSLGQAVTNPWNYIYISKCKLRPLLSDNGEASS
ncbi:hypothetical protein K439DRAFT_1614192 [Ramaria rubella]|nr:hypothetical protein K439DRAFT_1614192 [Ramaria rubella]